MRLAANRVPLILLGLGIAGCVTRGDIEEIKENQKKILEKLDRPGRGGPQAPPQRPQGPDAATTYSVPVGDAAAVGPADAWVTVVAISDFQ
jgi:hypothetical protein